jgi:hypothetical protein
MHSQEPSNREQTPNSRQTVDSIEQIAIVNEEDGGRGGALNLT